MVGAGPRRDEERLRRDELAKLHSDVPAVEEGRVDTPDAAELNSAECAIEEAYDETLS